MASIHDRELFDIKEVCQLLALTPSSLRRLMDTGLIPRGHKVPGTRMVRWFRRDLEDYLAKLRLGLLDTVVENKPEPKRRKDDDKE